MQSFARTRSVGARAIAWAINPWRPRTEQLKLPITLSHGPLGSRQGLKTASCMRLGRHTCGVQRANTYAERADAWLIHGQSNRLSDRPPKRGWAPGQEWGCGNVGFGSAHGVGAADVGIAVIVANGLHQRMQSAAVSSAECGCRPHEKEWVDAKLVKAFSYPDPEQGLSNSRNLAARLQNSYPSGRLAGEGPAEMFRFSSIARVLSRPRGRR